MHPDPIQVRAVTFADAANEWLWHGELERANKPSTLRDYRSALNKHLLPAFGHRALRSITNLEIEQWRREAITERGLSRRNANKLVSIMHGIFERARKLWGIEPNPLAAVDRLPERYDSGDFDFYTPAEVHALAQAAGSEQDGAIFLTAALTGLRRGELLALRWRDVDFPGEAIRVMASADGRTIGTPKSGHGRTVPMATDVARTLAQLKARPRFTGSHDFVFISASGQHLDGSALRRRYATAQRRAGLRALRFHALRHTFGSVVINHASPVQVQHWLGHADQRTTARYLHHKHRPGDALLISNAFRVPDDGTDSSNDRAGTPEPSPR
jgi:integrase